MSRQSGLLLFILLLLILPATGADEPVPSLTVKLQEFTRTVLLSGELQAVDRTTVTVPRVRRMRNMVISYLAPEGSLVSQGDLLIQFDASELETNKLEREKQREDARIKIAQTRADLETRRQDLLLAKASALRDLGVARLYVGIDAQLIPAADAEKYQYDSGKAKIELEKAEERLTTLEETWEAESRIVQLEFEEADLDLQRLNADLEKLVVRAPRRGMVIHADNPSRAGKIQVADSVWSGAPIIYLPNMDRMMVEAYAYDSDFPLLRPGDRAEVVLDAAPEHRFNGEVGWISESAQPRQFRSQLRAFKVGVVLDSVDANLMKPGMSARVSIPISRADQLVVPRSAVQLASDGKTFVQLADSRQVEIQILDVGETEVAVKGDLQPGDRLRFPGSNGNSSPLLPHTEWVKVDAEDYRFFVSGNGTLEAARQVSIGPPAIPDSWRFKIVSLVPEGVAVEKGDLLVSFDPTEVMRDLREEEADLHKVLEELEKTRASEELKLKDLEIQLEEARVQDEKAANKLVQAREFESNLKVKEAEFEAQYAKLRVELLEKKLSFVKESSGLQVRILEDRQRLLEYRINTYRNALDELTIEAPDPGVVIYETNWRNEKKQIGSDVFRMEKILSLPDLESLVVRGQVAEVDAGRVRPGLEVVVNLDALPDRPLRGRVREIGTIFRRASFDRPVKVLDVVVALDRVDALFMRPGMVARLEVLTHDFRSVLAVPLSSVETQAGQSFVWVKKGEGVERREVTLGEDNGLVVVVENGLSPGEEVASRPQGEAS